MTEIQMSSKITVKLIRHSSGDDTVVQAAQVSAKGENNPDTVPYRLIKALMSGRHGSPFEHNSFTFFVEAPIFVFREWMRHRVGSFNEMSGRYTQLPGKFYIPATDRKMFNIGTKMKPEFVDYETYSEGTLLSSDGMHSNRFINQLMENSFACWREYKEALDNNIANEVARMVLPVNIYSQMYWTVNARSLMNFLSLRVESDESLVKSYPQKEINMGADQIEAIFSELMPLTYQAFVENGRVAP